MEEILKEILMELKEIRKEIRVIEDNPNPLDMKITIKEDMLVEKVIKSINTENRRSYGANITV